MTRREDEILATPGHDVAAPSGDHTLHVVETDDGWGFEILADDGTVTYRADRTVSPRFRTFVLWDEDGRVWVYSSDVGTYVWERSGTDWTSRPWRGSGLTAPPFLRDAVPERFG